MVVKYKNLQELVKMSKLSKQLKKEGIILSPEGIRLIYETTLKNKEKEGKTTTNNQL